MQTLDYFFDFLSPYSYLSWKNSRKYTANWSSHGIKVNYYPVTMATIIHHYETKGPAEITPKRNYLMKHCSRTASENNIQFKVPEELPFNSLYALRCSLKENCGDKQEQVIDVLFNACWGKGLDIGNPDVIIEQLEERNIDGKMLIERSSEKEMRKSLKLNNKKAIEIGVFGVPSFIIKEELFWGNDSLNHLNKFIDGEDSLDKNLYENFISRYGE